MIIVEHHIRIDDLPNKVSEDFTRFVLKKPDGRRTLLKTIRNGVDVIDVLDAPSTAAKDCSTCRYEAYYLEEIDLDIQGREIKIKRRDCINMDQRAQDYFTKNVPYTLSRKDIPPVTGCGYWKGNLNGK